MQCQTDLYLECGDQKLKQDCCGMVRQDKENFNESSKGQVRVWVLSMNIYMKIIVSCYNAIELFSPKNARMHMAIARIKEILGRFGYGIFPPNLQLSH
jgi:hypothetical protein